MSERLRIKYLGEIDPGKRVYSLDVEGNRVGKIQLNTLRCLTSWDISFPSDPKIAKDPERRFLELSQMLLGQELELMDRSVRHGFSFRVRQATPDGYRFMSEHFSLDWDICDWIGEPESADKILEEDAAVFDKYKSIFAAATVEDFWYSIGRLNIPNPETYDNPYDNRISFTGRYKDRNAEKLPTNWWVSVGSNMKYPPSMELFEWIDRYHRNSGVFSKIGYKEAAHVVQRRIHKDDNK